MLLASEQAAACRSRSWRMDAFARFLNACSRSEVGGRNERVRALHASKRPSAVCDEHEKFTHEAR